MNIKQLIYFIQVVESRSIAAAARQMEVAQPAVSLQISKLEKLLGTSLFTRGHHGVQLTEAGMLFQNYARLVVSQLERVRDDIVSLEASPKGRVTIAMTQATDNILALPLAHAINTKFPDIDLDLRTGMSYEVVNLLKNGVADVAIMYEDAIQTASIRQELLLRESLFFVSRPSNDNVDKDSIPFEKLQDYEIVVTPQNESMGHLVAEQERRTGIKLNKRRPYGQLMTSLRFASEGQCHLILPSSAFYHLENTGLLKSQKIIEPEIYRNVYIATDMNRPMRTISLRVIEFIKSCTYAEYKAGLWQGLLP